jgi:hypothetical protein|nr:MAG TPA: hypothetical protein [Caudoviricetes sp.]
MTYVHILEKDTEFTIEDLKHNLKIFSIEYCEDRDCDIIDGWSIDAGRKTSLDDVPSEGSVFDLFVGEGYSGGHWVEVERISTTQFKVLKVY